MTTRSFSLTLMLLAAALPVPAAPDSHEESACCAQLKTIGTALEVYASEHGGHYPQALSTLIPRYLTAVPQCPAAHSDTYSASYQVRTDPDAYRFFCQGTHHFSENLPAYSSASGLIRGAAAEAAAMTATPYVPNPVANLESHDPKSSSQLEGDYNDAVEALDEHQYDKAAAGLKKVLDSAKPDTPLSARAHGAMLMLASFQLHGPEADRQADDAVHSKAEGVADELAADLSKAADRWMKEKDAKRAEKLYRAALALKAAPKALTHAHAGYGTVLDSQHKIPEATHEYQLALEGAINWLTAAKRESETTQIRAATNELQYAGGLYANFLAGHGRKADATRVRANIDALLR